MERTYVVEKVHEPHQVLILESFNAGFVFFPVQDGCDFSGKLRRRRLETMELS